MRILEGLRQGTPEWEDARREFDTASEAPVMMGTSSKKTRNSLLQEKVTGIKPEPDPYVLELFAEGHRAEAAARLIVEQDILHEELFPVVCVDDDEGLLASLDGQTMSGEVIFEHKLWNELLAEQVRRGELDPEYYWQIEQEMGVSGAKRTLFVVSDGTAERMETMWYEPVPGRYEALLAGWRQFREDAATWEPSGEPQVVHANPIGRLPALLVQVKGEVVTSNLAIYRHAADQFFGNLRKDLNSDQDFADAEETIKFCEEGEAKIALLKDNILGQMASVNEVMITLDYIGGLFSKNRLDYTKLVDARKQARKVEIVTTAQDALAGYVRECNERVGGNYMPRTTADFAGAIKGKRSFALMQNAVDTLLANTKIAVSATADRIQANLKAYAEHAEGFQGPFPDLAQLVHKDATDFVAVVKTRVAEERAAVERRAEEARERIRQEEAERLAREAAAAAPAPAPATNVAATVASFPRPVFPAAPSGPPTLKLGEIGVRLGFTVTADFLASLGFHATRERSASLYHESSWVAICDALVAHIEAARDQPAAA